MRPRITLSPLLAALAALACGSKSPPDPKADDSGAPPASAAATKPGQEACAAAESEDTVLAWLRLRAQHPDAPCTGTVDARIAAASDRYSELTRDAPAVVLDEDGIWLSWASATMPTIPHPPGSDYDFSLLVESVGKYKRLFPHQTVERVWAAPDVADVDLLATVEALAGAGCQITRAPEQDGDSLKPKSTSRSALVRGQPPGLTASDECLLWWPVMLKERPALEPIAQAAPPTDRTPAGPPSNQACDATFQCPEGEECLGEMGDKKCRPATEADCRSYWRCETDGYCTLINGRCLLGVETDADCKKSYGNRPGGGFNPCELLGACRAVGGDCVE